MKINYSHISLSILLLLFITIPVQAQVTGVKQQSVNDSLLNVITDIDARIKDGSKTEISTTKGLFDNGLKRDSLFSPFIARLDSTSVERDEKGLVKFPFTWAPFPDNVTFNDTVIFEPAFLPAIFEGNILPRYTIGTQLDSLTKEKEKTRYRLISKDSTLVPLLEHANWVEDVRRTYYIDKPRRVEYNALNFTGSPVIASEVVEKKSVFKELLSTDDAVGFATPEVEKVKIRLLHWKKEGSHSLRISQNNLSDNWNGTGGDNSFFVNTYHKVRFDYQKDRITWKNELELKLDIVTTPSDEYHDMSIREDYLRAYSVFGVKAFNKWSYAFNMEAKTNLFQSYNKNSESRRTSFLSPLRVNMGLGMSYNLEKKSTKDKYRKLKLGAEISPLSINYIYVRDKKVDATPFIESDRVAAGKRSRTDFGSTVKMDMNYKINRLTTLNSRFSYFTNYKKVQAELENKFDFAINRYFSTSLNLYLRFDDAIGLEKRDDKWGYLQYNETLAFGLSYNW